MYHQRKLAQGRWAIALGAARGAIVAVRIQRKNITRRQFAETGFGHGNLHTISDALESIVRVALQVKTRFKTQNQEAH